jgi:hypothetical protein
MTKVSLQRGFGPRPAEARGRQKDQAAGRKIYRIKFLEERERPGKEVEFEAEDAYQALVIAGKEARRRAAELWLNGEGLCSIARRGDDFWEIQPVKKDLQR